MGLLGAANGLEPGSAPRLENPLHLGLLRRLLTGLPGLEGNHGSGSFEEVRSPLSRVCGTPHLHT